MVTGRDPRLVATVFTLVVGLLCGCSKDRGPTAPSALAPSGCTGQPINNVSVRFFGPPFTAQLFGESVNGQTSPVVIERSVVPCEYELSGQLLEGSAMNISLGFAAGQRAPAAGGIDPASIVIVEGVNPRTSRGSGDFPSCIVELGWAPPFPVNFRIKFRVVPDIREGARCG
jgi:hypothetical protein